ncbi:DUF72 domain-containing protein [Salinimonas sp. HHU 13199]|uniref:DUF72 domain-containing protein n=1 Tax=Salinimonas profundi TaxID=2729140 RepID=A0ABR8LHW3_9ALTE|nr:DUF72 domain-containing protein [Salinimonas profundi]MBD3585128.1 DUF72 domain-containing protein [Salinimonas profundi]
MRNQHFPDRDLPAPLYLGLPIWQHPSWPGLWLPPTQARTNALNAYAGHFSSVEGNSTFYALPDSMTCQRWYESVPATFRFTFKLNQQVSHADNILLNADILGAQLSSLAHLKEKLGPLMLQLPARFSPERLPELVQFIAKWPKDYCLAVEVRHPAFFEKGHAEKSLNNLLKEHEVNRVMMDTRALFRGQVSSEAMLDAREKKPRLPLHVWASGHQPVIRFVGHDDNEINKQCLLPWVDKCHAWRMAGISPFLFLHRADNKDAPWLAHLFTDLYNKQYPEQALPAIRLSEQPDQQALF